MYADLKQYMTDVRLNVRPGETFLFNRSVFPASTFNLGPQTVTTKHIDRHNKAGAWCVITSGGKFNPKLGGHLVLWNLRLLIEFPPGSTIAIPSALVEHSNASVAVGESRVSFTQYAAGALFRWVDLGHRTEVQCSKDQPELYRSVRAKDSTRFKLALGLYSTVAELHAGPLV